MRIILPLLALVIVIVPVSVAYGAEITYRIPTPIWYSYDCSNPSPTVFTKDDPGVSKFKYFSYFDNGKCYVILDNYDVSGLDTLTNATLLNYTSDSRANIPSNPSISYQYSTTCKLLHFNSPDLTAGAIIQTPDVYEPSFSCTGVLGNETKHNMVSLDSSIVSQFQNGVTGGNTTFSLMLFPELNNTMQSNLISNGYQYGLEDFGRSIYVNGDGFNCALIAGSGMCDFQEKPWKAIAIAFGADYIGEWFYVIAFFPFPMATYLITRNGTYAGFVGLSFMLFVEAINPMIFEIALTMILISASFGFYEVLKRRLLA